MQHGPANPTNFMNVFIYHILIVYMLCRSKIGYNVKIIFPLCYFFAQINF